MKHQIFGMLAAPIVGIGLVAAAVAPAAAGDKVILQFAWSAEAEMGGYFQALETGLYEAKGLDVEIRLGSPQMDSTQMLATGQVTFTTGTAARAFNAVAQDIPIVAVAAPFQKELRIVVSHKEAGYETLEDMKGKPALVAAAGLVQFWPFLKAKYGFTDDQLRPYTFNPQPFLADKTAIQQGYVTSEPFLLKKLGADVDVFLLADYGYDAYPQLITTTTKLVEEDPDLVQRFVDASLEGWKDYLFGDPAPGNGFITENNPEMHLDQIEYSRGKMVELEMLTAGEAAENGIGAMSDARWQAQFEQMTELGLVPSDIDWQSAYTLEFVNDKVAMQ